MWPQLSHSVWMSAQLVGFALVLVVLISVGLGIFSAQRPRSLLDGGVRLLTYASWSIPTFLIAFLMRRWILGGQSVSAFTYGPNSASTNGSHAFLIGPPHGGVVDWFRHMTLPALALALGLIGVYARYIRTAMLVSLREPYTIVARAKGLSERRVVYRHALRNSLIPFTSLLSFEMGGVIGASLAADAVFHLGGLADTFLGGLALADPFELTALVVVTAGVVAAFLIAADLLTGVL